mmetsp:Transcript_17883/g.30394  ORF Transcript_17883/g.30394 Transcript_17883/m.30394 type:complete len:138 (-) Transcript_17883:474-887(-)
MIAELAQLKQKNEQFMKNNEQMHKENAGNRQKMKQIQEKMAQLQTLMNRANEVHLQKVNQLKVLHQHEVKETKQKLKKQYEARVAALEAKNVDSCAKIERYELIFKQERQNDSRVLMEYAENLQSLQGQKQELELEV